MFLQLAQCSLFFITDAFIVSHSALVFQTPDTLLEGCNSVLISLSPCSKVLARRRSEGITAFTPLSLYPELSLHTSKLPLLPGC